MLFFIESLPSYTLIPTYTFINIAKIVPPTLLFQPGAINIEPYTDKYLEKFERCDPLHVSGKVSKAAKKVKKLESENVYTNIFS